MLNKLSAISRQQAIAPFPLRPRDSHKGLCGAVGVIGGANGMVGAALIAGRAALKLGSGLVHLGFLAENRPVVDLLQPELMLHSAADVLKFTRLDVLAIGNGLGCDVAAQKILYDALKLKSTLVLDADALNILAFRPDSRAMLLERKVADVMTPHPGEAARLLGCTTADVQADRPAAALELAKRLRCCVVLKGANSLIVTRDGRLLVNQTGNPGMSSAGMGDALSGIIAAFIAQGMTADDALILAVHLHGAAGDALAEQVASIGMNATEVIEWSRRLLHLWLNSSD